jgi:hypothetical protein
MEFDRWWEDQPEELYWLEVTDRNDLGIDLNAPQQRDDGQEYYGYSLIREIRNGDIVFHYHRDRRAIVAVSRAAGKAWADKVVWAAHGTVARDAGVRPYERSGWRLGLDAFQVLDIAVRLDDLRSCQTEIQAIRHRLEESHHAALYFPFESIEKRDLRPTQAYITKLPAEIVELFPALAAAAQRLRAAKSARQGGQIREAPDAWSLGVPYREADEQLAVSEYDPFSVDPALVERANHGHALAQNALAAYLVSCGIEPRSPAPDEPNYDLAWANGGTVYVVEVKSLTDTNEEKQLRLGLGQVLRYRQILRHRYAAVNAILLPEREPYDASWTGLCQELGISLIWPTCIPSLKVGG